MPKFTVRRRIDAWVDYTATVEAPDAKAAALRAREHEEAFRWGEGDAIQFDARLFVALDENGNEIEDTQCGDF